VSADEQPARKAQTEKPASRPAMLLRMDSDPHATIVPHEQSTSMAPRRPQPPLIGASSFTPSGVHNFLVEDTRLDARLERGHRILYVPRDVFVEVHHQVSNVGVCG
jgi:hypothetical protein